MKNRRWTVGIVGLTLGLLLLAAFLATPARAAGSATLIEFRSAL